MPRQGGGIAENHELHTGARDGYVHAPQIGKEANLPVIVAAHKTDEDHIALLSLKSVDGIGTQQAAYRTQHAAGLDEPPQVLHLCLVGEISPKSIRSSNMRSTPMRCT